MAAILLHLDIRPMEENLVAMEVMVVLAAELVTEQTGAKAVQVDQMARTDIMAVETVGFLPLEMDRELALALLRNPHMVFTLPVVAAAAINQEATVVLVAAVMVAITIQIMTIMAQLDRAMQILVVVAVVVRHTPMALRAAPVLLLLEMRGYKYEVCDC